MDLVSFETQQEYDWVKGFIDGGVKFFWTSGRKSNSQTIILEIFLDCKYQLTNCNLELFSGVHMELVFSKVQL